MCVCTLLFLLCFGDWVGGRVNEEKKKKQSQLQQINQKPSFSRIYSNFQISQLFPRFAHFLLEYGNRLSLLALDSSLNRYIDIMMNKNSNDFFELSSYFCLYWTPYAFFKNIQINISSNDQDKYYFNGFSSKLSEWFIKRK